MHHQRQQIRTRQKVLADTAGQPFAEAGMPMGADDDQVGGDPMLLVDEERRGRPARTRWNLDGRSDAVPVETARLQRSSPSPFGQDTAKRSGRRTSLAISIRRKAPRPAGGRRALALDQRRKAKLHEAATATVDTKQDTSAQPISFASWTRRGTASGTPASSKADSLVD